MKLTQAHLNFYREKKTPTPGWAVRMAKERKYPWTQTLPKTSVDELINSQLDKRDGRIEAQNLCNLIKMASRHFTGRNYESGIIREYANLRAYLYHLAFTPYATDSKRRTGYAQKWYRKLYLKVKWEG